jgi:ubiquitin-conjugating enzyme E2 variant
VSDAASVTQPKTPAGQRWLEGAALALAVLLLALLAVRLARRVDDIAPAAILLASLIVSYLAADLVSGLAHWFGDRFFEEDTPLIGRRLIAPFREHHRNPLAMTRHGSFELLGNSALVALPLLAAGWWWADSIFVEGLTLGFILASIGANQFHAWAHAARVPPGVAWLQVCWIVLSPAHHARHHCGGHDANYCVTTGWMNCWTDGLGLFGALERALRRLGLPAARVP